MKRLTATVLALLAASAFAGTAEQHRDRAVVLDLYARTVACMVSGTQAFQRQGVTDADAVIGFTVGLCGRPLRAALQDRARWSRADADAFVRAMAQRAFDEF